MSKKYSDLVPGNSIYVLSIDPDTHEPLNIAGGIVDSVNHSGTVIGIRLPNPSDKSQTLLLYFRVNPEDIINNSLLEDKEHRTNALFETRSDAISEYIKWCEDKIQQYKNNIGSVEKFMIP